MDIQEVLDFAEQLLQEKTGKGLTELQREILQRAWNKETYTDLIKDSSYSSSYVRTVGAELFQMLSDALEKHIKKTNFRQLLEGLERFQISIGNDNNIHTIQQDCIEIKFCTSTLQAPKKQFKTKTSVTVKSYYDLTNLPRKCLFYGRCKDLETLQSALTNYQLINLYGLKGIGKTSVIVELISQIKEQFTCIIYQSLVITPTIEELEIELIEGINNIYQNNQDLKNEVSCLSNPKQRRNLLLKLLREVSCLIIFDDVESLFVKGELAGQYQECYQDYSILFEQIANLQDQSHLMLISDVKIEYLCLNNAVFSYNLQGLDCDAVELMLKEMGLIIDDFSEKILTIYQGHPLWLRQVTAMIKGFLNSDFGSNLLKDSVMIPQSMKRDLDCIFNQLSTVEKQIIMMLVDYDHPICLEELLPKLSLSPNDIINGIKSLGDRSLIQTISTNNNQSNLILIPVIREYCRILQQ
jgi:hypothetical protein